MAKALKGHPKQERFRLDKCIGQGGMGTVYKAYDVLLDRTVAVKILHATLAVNDEAVQFFKREVQLASTVSHPNVLRVFDFGEMHGAKLISMAYVDSPNLREIIRRAGRLSWVQSVNYGVQICSGLEAAHAAGVIHRDLKPQNILVDSEDRVYVADFGLAKALGEDQSLVSQIGQRPGTPCYMSPEQCLGLPVDQRTDVFSFGAVLHAMLTGEPPLAGGATENAGWREVILDQAKLAESGAPGALLQVVRRCLRYGPEDRYPEVADIMAELRPLSEKSGHACPGEAIHLDRPRRIRWPSVWPRALAALLALVAIVLLWVSFRGTRRGAPSLSTSAGPKVPAKPETSPDSRVSAVLAYQQGKELLENWKSVSDLRSSIALLESASSRAPEFSAAHAGIVTSSLLLYRQTEEVQWLDRASRAAQTAQAVDAGAVHSKIAAAEMHMARGRFRDAVTVLEPVVAEQEGPDQAYRLLAQAYLRLDAPLEAIRCSQKAVEVNPYSWRNHHALAVTYYSAQRLREAETEFRRALTLNPKAYGAVNNLGAICLRTGRFEEAISFLELSLRLLPAPETYSNVGTLYFLTGRYQLAAMAFEKAVSMRPKSELLIGNLGWAYQLAGRQNEATRMLLRAIELARSHLKVDPADRATRRRLVLYYAKSENLPAAEEILTELRAEAPEDCDFLYTQAVVQVFRGRTGAAVMSLELALQAGYPATLAFADPAWRQLREEDRFHALRERYRVP